MQNSVRGRVSVIIPAYNGAAFIHRAVESALAQTYADVEVIVVDDCSTDNIAAALEPYRRRIIFHRTETNSGISAARNYGAERASGDLLAFLDQDDWWPVDLLARIVPDVTHGTAVCYDNYNVPEDAIAASDDVITAAAETQWESVYDAAHWSQDWLTRDEMHIAFDGFPMPKFVMTRMDFDAAAGFDSRFNGVEDFHLLVKLLARGTRIKMVREPKGFYLVHAQSTTSASGQTAVAQRAAAQKWSLMSKTLPAEHRLTDKAEAFCHAGRTYWKAREAQAILKSLISRDGTALTWQDAVRIIAPSLPTLMRIKLKSLLSKSLTPTAT